MLIIKTIVISNQEIIKTKIINRNIFIFLLEIRLILKKNITIIEKI